MIYISNRLNYMQYMYLKYFLMNYIIRINLKFMWALNTKSLL